jgi:hypothetical protein
MAHESNRSNEPKSILPNGLEPDTLEARSLGAAQAFKAPIESPQSPGGRGGDSSRSVDDALMRCYNG